MKSQEKIKRINEENKLKTTFIGAWTKFGFHEDGFTSGCIAAQMLGAELPFEIKDSAQIRKIPNSLMNRLIRSVFSFIHSILMIVVTIEKIYFKKKE